MNQILGINQLSQGVTSQIKPKGSGEKSFGDLLSQNLAKAKEIKFSSHALTRMERRKINLTSDHMGMLNQAIQKAEDKGACESLVLLNDLAFVVSVKSRTVITAVNRGGVKEGIFTNIDSTVIL